jgi:hypothetical protein
VRPYGELRPPGSLDASVGSVNLTTGNPPSTGRVSEPVEPNGNIHGTEGSALGLGESSYLTKPVRIAVLDQLLERGRSTTFASRSSEPRID